MWFEPAELSPKKKKLRIGVFPIETEMPTVRVCGGVLEQRDRAAGRRHARARDGDISLSALPLGRAYGRGKKKSCVGERGTLSADSAPASRSLSSDPTPLTGISKANSQGRRERR